MGLKWNPYMKMQCQSSHSSSFASCKNWWCKLLLNVLNYCSVINDVIGSTGVPMISQWKREEANHVPLSGFSRGSCLYLITPLHLLWVVKTSFKHNWLPNRVLINFLWLSFRHWNTITFDNLSMNFFLPLQRCGLRSI